MSDVHDAPDDLVEQLKNRYYTNGFRDGQETEKREGEHQTNLTVLRQSAVHEACFVYGQLIKKSTWVHFKGFEKDVVLMAQVFVDFYERGIEDASSGTEK